MSLELRFRERILKEMFGEEYAELETYEYVIRDFYFASTAHIYMLVEKLSRNCGDYGRELSDNPVVVDVPSVGVWDLHLGDGVKIKSACSLVKLKCIQQKTIGWNKKLKAAINQTGLVMSVCSNLDSHIQVFFPTINLLCELYAGVLEKVPLKGKKGSLFRKGDTVVTNAEEKIAALLMRGFGDFPKSFLGQVGLVTGVTSSGVHVTFQGSITCTVNPALLKKTDKQYETKIFSHPKGYKAGDKVRVISNLQKLIKMQNENYWEPSMSDLRGKEVLVVRLREDGSMRVCDEKGKSWSLSSESVMTLSHIEKSDEGEPEEDVPFELQENVTLKLKPTTRRIMEKEKIPLSFLEYLCLPVPVIAYNKKLDARIQYNSTQFVRIKTSLIEKASEQKTSRSIGVAAKIKSLKVGDAVYVDAGPPNYVSIVLDRMGVTGDIAEALTTPGKVLGFVGPEHVVVGYGNGRKYKINRKYLTLPEKFSLDDKKYEVDGDQALQIVEVLKISLEAIKGSGESNAAASYAIDTFSLTRGDPPRLDIHVTSTTQRFDRIFDSLYKKTGWTLEQLSPGIVEIKESKVFKHSIILVFHLSGENPLPPPYSSGLKKIAADGEKNESTVGEISATVSGDGEGANLKAERERLGTQPIFGTMDDSQQYGWIRFGNSQSGRPMFIPYVVGDPEQAREDTVS